MDWPVRAFVKSSLAWLACGVTLGVCMSVHPVWTIYRPAHVHMNLLGFVTMMICGVAYHVVPRFAASRLWSRKLAVAHWWFANAGLAGMVAGFILRASDALVPSGAVVLGAGGVLSAIGAYAFVFNIWKSMKRTAPAMAAVQGLRPAGAPKPVTNA